MSRRYFAIVKNNGFQGRTEEFSNVYLYEEGETTEAGYEAIIAGIVAAERPVFATTVNFVRASVYTTQGLNGPLDLGSTMHEQALNTSGTAVSQLDLYRECAHLVKWPLPPTTDLLGRRYHRSLKKWLHSCTSLAPGGAYVTGRDPLPAQVKATLQAYAAAVSETVNGAPLVAPDGTPVSDPVVIHDYLEHRQFPRGRKES